MAKKLNCIGEDCSEDEAYEACLESGECVLEKNELFKTIETTDDVSIASAKTYSREILVK